MDISNTNTDCEYKSLTWQQQQAVDLLLLGCSQELITTELGIERETLDRWCDDSNAFAIALKSRQQSLRSEATTVGDIYGRSIARVERELAEKKSFEKEDVKLAFDLIKWLSPYNYLHISEQFA